LVSSPFSFPLSPLYAVDGGFAAGVPVGARRMRVVTAITNALVNASGKITQKAMVATSSS
jgi:hypothetical protein